MGEQLKDVGRTLLATLRAFRDERGTTTAAALAYATFLSLIPMLLLLLILVEPLSGALLQGSAGSGQSVLDWVLERVAPQSQSDVERFVLQLGDDLAGATGKLGMLGVAGFLVTSALLFIAIEDALNDVWKSPRRRKIGTRIAYFWCVATLVPVSALLSISAVSGVPLLGTVMQDPTIRGVSQWAMSVAMIGGMYLVFPVTHVSWRAAFWGGCVAGSLFELSKVGFAWYVSSGTSYQALYGAAAAIPIFIVWTYISWAIVLLGAHLSRIIDGGLPKPVAPPPPERLAVAVAIEAARHFIEGRGPAATADIASKLGVSSESVDAASRRLCAAGVLAEVENTEESMHVIPARNPADTPAVDVVVAARDAGSEGDGGSAQLAEALRRMDAAAREATPDLTLAQLATRSADTVMRGADPAFVAAAGVVAGVVAPPPAPPPSAPPPPDA